MVMNLSSVGKTGFSAFFFIVSDSKAYIFKKLVILFTLNLRYLMLAVLFRAMGLS